MKTPDEIKHRLELCACGSDEGSCMEVCSYHGGEAGKFCTEVLASQALAYIRQLEARVAELEKPLEPMTLDEVVEKSKRVNDNVIWLERPDEEYGYDDAECIPALVSNRSRIGADCIQYVRFLTWPKQEIFFDISGEDKADYGKTWRCWSRRPTDEERGGGVG